MIPLHSLSISCRPASFIARLSIISSLAFCAFAVPARAATIAWGTPTTISGDSNVVNGGTNAGLTVLAFRLGITGLTAAVCNGVTFQPFAFAEGTNANVTIGNTTIQPYNSSSTNTAAGSTVAPYGNLPADTRNLLQSTTLSNGNTIILTMGGLTVGQAYTFQWWVNNSGNFTGYGGQQVGANSGTTFSSTGRVVCNANQPVATSPNGGLGQFVVGTFTADATNQSVYYRSANDVAILNAFQLRTGNVPEPSTWAAIAAGTGLLGFVARRRKMAL